MQHGAAVPFWSSLSTQACQLSGQHQLQLHRRAHPLLAQGNSANLGGALFADTQCNATLLGVQFNSNLARQYGGAILTGDESRLRVSLSTFTGNGDSPCFAPPLVGACSQGTARRAALCASLTGRASAAWLCDMQLQDCPCLGVATSRPPVQGLSPSADLNHLQAGPAVTGADTQLLTKTCPNVHSVPNL